MTNQAHPISKIVAGLILGLALSACGSFSRDSAPSFDVDHTRVPNAVPKVEPYSKYGNPASYEVQGKRYRVLKTSTGFRQTGVASWYGTKFHGRRTSSGERYNMYAMTAAHKTLPIPVYVEVHNLDNDRRIVVRVNDRGPFVNNRIIDLSYVAAKKLGITANGTGRVEIRVIDPGSPQAHQTTSTAISQPSQATPVALATSIATTTAATKVALNAQDPQPGKLYLQVGAFTDRNNASQLLDRLVAATTENVLINRKATGNYSVYRVRIGPLHSEAVAQQLRSQLQPLGINSPHLIVE